MSAETPAENNPVRHSMLSRHEDGYDVIDTFEVLNGSSGVEVKLVKSIYANDLDLAYRAITGAKKVPPRAMPDHGIGPPVH